MSSSCTPLPVRRQRTMRSFLICLVGSLPAICAGWDPIGPFGGSAVIVRVDRHHPGTVLAATSNAQLFRSTDDGDSWRALPFPAQLRATLHALVVDPWNEGVYLAGLSSDTDQYSGILQTSDGGLTWKRLADPRLKQVWSIALYAQDPRVIVVGTENGVLLSRNSGETWTKLRPEGNADMKPVVSVSFDPADPNVIYAGTPHLPWKTVDGGTTWHAIRKGMLDDSDVFSLLVDDRLRRRLFASTCGGIYRSIDGGASWAQLVQPVGASNRTYFIAQHPSLPKVLFAGTAHGLIKSEDSGSTWRRLSSASTRSIAFDPDRPARIFVATDDAGLFRSDDLGKSLEQIIDGFCNRNLNSLVGFGDTLYLNMRDSSGSVLLQRESSKAMWEQVTTSPELMHRQVLTLMASESRQLYVITADELLVSTDHGENWAAMPLPPTEFKLRKLLFVSPDGETMLMATEHDLYQTSNKGQTWSAAQFGSSAIFPETSQDSVKSSTSTTPSGHDAESELRDLEFFNTVSTEGGNLLTASSRGLIRSTDGGRTWQVVQGLFGTSTVRAICKHPVRRGVLFASQYGMIFRSQDDGLSWKPLAEVAETGDAIKALLMLPDRLDRLFILVQGRGVYEMAIPVE